MHRHQRAAHLGRCALHVYRREKRAQAQLFRHAGVISGGAGHFQSAQLRRHARADGLWRAVQSDPIQPPAGTGGRLLEPDPLRIPNFLRQRRVRRRTGDAAGVARLDVSGQDLWRGGAGGDLHRLCAADDPFRLPADDRDHQGKERRTEAETRSPAGAGAVRPAAVASAAAGRRGAEQLELSRVSAAAQAPKGGTAGRSAPGAAAPADVSAAADGGSAGRASGIYADVRPQWPALLRAGEPSAVAAGAAAQAAGNV